MKASDLGVVMGTVKGAIADSVKEAGENVRVIVPVVVVVVGNRIIVDREWDWEKGN